MLETLNSLDTRLFFLLNGFHSPFFDNFMFAFSGKWTWVPFYISLLYILIRTWEKQSVWIILALVLCIVFADQVSSGIIKNLVQRYRPSRTEDFEGLVHIVKGYRGGRFGFVSSHAANTFALALFCSLLFRNKTFTTILFVWAFITSYSRIYLGVHYPGDISGGIVVGILSALVCFYLLKKYRPQILCEKPEITYSNQNLYLNKLQLYIPVLVILVTIAGIIVYSLVGI